MVDITQCELCGRTIPATEHGCAYCDRERANEPESDYVPMARRWLLWLFVFLCALGTWLGFSAGMELLRRGHHVGWLSMGRAVLCGATALAIVKRRPVAPWIALGLLGFEIVFGLLALRSLLPPHAWTGGWISPLWAVIFVFYFARADVRAHFEPRLRDRLEVLDLLREIEKRRR